MEGVRVSGIDAQCSVQVLWQYFDGTGRVVKAIYYPLLNNDAVIIFQHPSGTTDALTENHKKWKVSPLPNQVFRQQCVWVETDLSVLVQATEAYQDCLRNTGQLDFSVDNTSGELVLCGQPYQIEWAWNYLSTLRDSQFHIARTLQTEAVNPSGLSNGSLHVGRSVYEPSSHGSTHSPYGQRHEAEQQKKGKVTREDLTNVTSLRLDNLTGAYDLSPRSSERYEDVVQGGTRSPYLHDEDVLGAGIRQTSTYSEKRDTKRSTDARERRRRQEDANDTFNKFASLPASNSRPPYEDSSQHTDPEHLSMGSRRDVLRSTMPSQTRLEKSERESGLEREFQSLGFRDAGDHYHYASGGYQSLQTDYGRQRESMHADEDRAGSLYTRERPSAAAAAAAAAADPSLYALSTTSAELTNKQFQIGKSLILKIYMDNIIKTRTDAVVNAANWELKNIGGVAGALAKAAGPEMEEECHQLQRKHGSLSTAQVVKTKAYGQLAHLKYVIHTVGPIYISTDVDRSVFELAQTFLNCLEFAEKLCLTSVTFPFISTGIFGMPVEHCILSLVTALQVFSEGGRGALSHLREVHFINNDINVVCEAIIMMEQRLAMETALAARQRLEEGVEHYGRFVFPYCQSTSSRLYESERYATWDSTKLKTTVDVEDRDRSRSSARPSSHLLSAESSEMRSLQLSASKTGDHRQRSSSLDRRNLTVHSGSTQPHSGSPRTTSRDPSPRPQPRPRSNSLTLSGRTPSASTKPSTSTSSSQPGGGSGGGGKHKPVIKKSLTGVSNKTTGLAKKLASKKNSQSAGRNADYSGNDTDSASAAGSEMDDADRNCMVCVEPLRHPRKLPCGHTFCSDCIDHVFAIQPNCPKCKTRFTTSSRKQPKDGTMTYTFCQYSDLPGHDECGTIIIKYTFPSGKQEDCHPHPGRAYEGTHQTAYLPDNSDGNEVLKRLKKAFDCGLLFTIGESSTGGRDVVTWSDIPHKTSKAGGSKSGYPDPGFLKRVKEKLAAKGITSA